MKFSGQLFALAILAICSIARAHEISSKSHQSACMYRKAVNCLTDFVIIHVSKFINVAKKKQVLKQKIIDDICQRPYGMCASTYSTEDCSPNQKNLVTRFEDAVSASITLICREDANYLRNISRTLHCFELLKLTNCIKANGFLSPIVIFGTRYTPEHFRAIEKKAIRCLDTAQMSPDECGERPDIEGTRDILRVFLARADFSRPSRSDANRRQSGSHITTVLALGVMTAAAVSMRHL